MVTKRGCYTVAAAVLGLALAGCASRQQGVDAPAADTSRVPPPAPGPQGEMEVGVSFTDPAAESAVADEDAAERHEPPPTQTYSPANKLSPEEKGAAGAP